MRIRSKIGPLPPRVAVLAEREGEKIYVILSEGTLQKSRTSLDDVHGAAVLMQHICDAVSYLVDHPDQSSPIHIPEMGNGLAS